jgi:hypothetical protein
MILTDPLPAISCVCLQATPLRQDVPVIPASSKCARPYYFITGSS